MNYYIEGNPAKSEQIKAAFESKGFDVGTNSCAQKGLYFTFDGKVCYTDDYVYPRDMMLKRFIKNNPDYKELELPVESKFKVGDWVAYKNGDTFAGGLKSVQVKAVEGDRYIFTQNTNGSCRFIDRTCHLWTIADAKDGDVLMLNGKPFIYSHGYGKNYCYIDDCGQFRANFNLVFEGNCVLPAAKQERDLLFAKMKEAGYEWDADKKELRKIQPHYDIANFKPFDKVMIRFGNNDTWRADFFSHIKEDRGRCFVGIGYANKQCIPYNDDTKHLLGTTDMCDEKYINW